MKKALQLTTVLFICSLFLTNIKAQPNIQWEKNYGGSGLDDVASIYQTTDGGYIMTGNTNSNMNGDVSGSPNGVNDYWIVKIDSIGSIQWEKNFGGSTDQTSRSIQQTTDGGYIIAGFTESSASGDVSGTNNGTTDYWIIKLNASGNLQWEKNLGGSLFDEAFSIQQTSDGGFVVAGKTRSSASGDVSGTNNGNDDFWIVKLDGSGNLQWEKNYGGNELDEAKSIQQTIDGGYIVAGQTRSNNNGDVSGINNGLADYWIIKLDGSGNLQWEKNYGGNAIDAANSIQQTTDGGYIVAGETRSSASGDVSGTNNGTKDFWIVKLDGSGNLQWEKNYGGNDDDVANSIQQTNDGGFILAGLSESSVSGDVTGNNGSVDIWIVKLDGSGNLQWEKNYGGSGFDGASEIRQTTDKGYIIGGGTTSSMTGDVSGTLKGFVDSWVIKLAPVPQNIQKQTLELDLKIYPNPAKNQFTLEILDEKAKLVQSGVEAGNLQIEITDAKGKIIQTQSLEIQPFMRKDFNLNGFPAGVYFINIQNELGILTKRINIIN